MPADDEGVVSVSYRPLATMDELHILLVAAISEQSVDSEFLAQVYSLPSNVISKELAILESYGLAQKAGKQWAVTDRGQRSFSVWNTFQQSNTIETQTSGRQWLLGPGEFSFDEMIRDKAEIAALANRFGITDTTSAVKFLAERREAAERFEAFVRNWPPRDPHDTKHGVFSEALVFDHLKLAETDDALTRLEELLTSHVALVIESWQERQASEVRENGGINEQDAMAAFHEKGQDIVKRFENERRTQRRQNRHLTTVKMVCEVQLAGAWLSASIGPLSDVFNSEPAAFVFRSTVPIVQAKRTTKPASSFVPRPKQAAKTVEAEEGILRTLFRWLFG